MTPSKEWLELVKEVIELARKNMSYKDFEVFAKFSPSQLGKSYFDRMNVLSEMEKDELVIVEDGRLRINNKQLPTWLRDGLVDGYEKSWEILELLDLNGKLLKKVDYEILKEIGLDGEKAVMEQLKNELWTEVYKKVRHVSLTDDSLGYDIYTPSCISLDDFLLYEVKTSSYSGKFFHFYISRNEAKIAAKNTNWFLIGVIKKSNKFEIVGHLKFDVFESFLPTDNSENVSWESAKVKLPMHLLRKNLP